MDEGVDPKNLCWQIVTTIDEHAELESLANPEIRTLFIDWMEELEQEILNYRKVKNELSADDLIKRFGISRQGAEFLLKKMKEEGKL
ncbi:MAG: hypothetical protein GY846_07415 [Deltaproteobacteria bacterium]|nr:hypothetical protein [Deltaproteobacteria bacterium]